MVIKYLDDYKIPFNLVLVKPKTSKIKFPYILNKIFLFCNMLNSGNYIALSKHSLFTFKLAFQFLKYKKSAQYKSLIEPFINIETSSLANFVIEDINHVALYNFLKKENYDIGLLAGVGIVHSDILNSFSKFCLNAHPGPLPECRGGGAIQFTLSKMLQPAASVHYATSKIDAGSILMVSEIVVLKTDNINSISDRVTIHSANMIAEVVSLFLSGKQLVELPNTGKLNYWKDCTEIVQKEANAYLSKLKNNPNQSVRRWPN